MNKIYFLSCPGKDAETLGKCIENYSKRKNIKYVHIIERSQNIYINLANKRIGRQISLFKKIEMTIDLIINGLYRIVFLKENILRKSKTKHELVTKNINSREVYDFVNGDDAVYIVYGTSIIGNKLLSKIKTGYNIHTSLLPSYKGCRSELWALTEGKRNMIGVTIHKLTNVLDNGDIIAQTSLQTESNDEAEIRKLNVNNACILVKETLERLNNSEDKELGKFYGPLLAESFRSMPKTMTYIKYMNIVANTSINKKRMAFLTKILYAVSLWIIINFVYMNWGALQNTEIISIDLIFCGIALQGLFVASQFILWKWCFGGYCQDKIWLKKDLVQTAYVYSMANILSYLPGKITSLFALTGSAMKVAISRKQTLKTTIVFQLYSITVSAYIIIIILISQNLATSLFYLIMPTLLIGVLEKLKKQMKTRATLIEKFSIQIKALNAYMFGWVLMISSLICYIVSYSGDISMQAKGGLAISYLTSYAAGQIAFVLPSGLGVVELTITQTCEKLGCNVNTIGLVVGILAVRIFSIAINASIALITAYLIKKNNNRQENMSA